MKINTTALLFLFPFSLFLSADTQADQLKQSGPKTDLDRYLEKPDESYKWKILDQGKIGKTEYGSMILTSQTWKKLTWKHQLFVLKPSTCKESCSHGLLFIGGGSWKPELEEKPKELPREAARLALVAEQLKTPVAILLQVPNQPIFEGKYEDQIIAYTFEKFVRTGDGSWPLLLPMVKAAHRGMDASAEFASKEWKIDLNSFTVTGASKRGWTTWLTGATDKRVTAIAPMVIDVLNMKPQMKFQKQVWGKYSDEISDYTERGLQDILSTPKGDKLREIVDPYNYRHRLDQPKLILLGTNDPYWPVDALQFYWDGLKGQKHVVYVPNNGHDLRDINRIVGSLNALHAEAAGGKPMPRLKWNGGETKGGGFLAIDASSEKPDRIQIWQANSKQRDFRRSKWTSKELEAEEVGRYHAEIRRPFEGSTAFFVEAVYTRNGFPCFISTNVMVVEATE